MQTRGGRLAGVLTLAALVIGGLVAAPSTAGAGVSAQVSCSYTVDPTTLPPGGGFITVSGTAPGTSVVRIFIDGELAVVVNSAPVTGAFSADIFVTASVELSVGVDDYPFTPCIGTAGSDTGGGTNVVVGGNRRGRGGLAGTGSSDTVPFVMVGLAAVSLGAVFVAASRRRRGVRGQA